MLINANEHYYRNRATSRRSRLVAAHLTFQAKMHFLCVFMWLSGPQSNNF